MTGVQGAPITSEAADETPQVCGYCQQPIPASSPSDDFCRERCQRAWMGKHVARDGEWWKIRPSMDPHFETVYNWLSVNGVNEWLPEKPEVRIADGQITYTSFVWNGPRGFDADFIVVDLETGTALIEDRTVPLHWPIKDSEREAALAEGVRLVEEVDHVG